MSLLLLLLVSDGVDIRPKLTFDEQNGKQAGGCSPCTGQVSATKTHATDSGGQGCSTVGGLMEMKMPQILFTRGFFKELDYRGRSHSAF